MSFRLPPDLTVGFEEIDAGHRELFQHIEALGAAAKADDGAGTRAALAALGDYLAQHFAAECALMEAARYPDRGRHKAAHDLFMQDFAQLACDLATSGLSVPVVQWMTTRVPEWLKFHIQVNDIPLGRFLASKRHGPGLESGRLPKPRVSS